MSQANTNPPDKLNVESRTIFHGDNLDFLRGINSESVDLIATDPPFNKGRDFHATPDSLASGASFQDRWSWDKDVHEEWTDQITNDHPKLMEAIESAKEAHSDGMGAFMCFMAVRLLEMRRILKDTGAIYLHCDPTASHYLKAVMDAIFGYRNFRNEIIWHYGGPVRISKEFPKKHDMILFFSRTNDHVFNPVYEDLPDYLYKRARQDPDGRLWVDQRLGVIGETLEKYRREGRTFRTKTGGERLKQYLDEMEGKPINTVWNMPIINSQSKERFGYPTQKPLALYERIIKASSNESDIVLDPFCGCATTLVAAERLGRQWIGMDIWDKAHETVIKRLMDEGLASPDGDPGDKLYTVGQITYSKEPPERTDEGEYAASYLEPQNRRALKKWQKLSNKVIREILEEAQRYKEDERGVICAGCGRILEPEFMQLDHIIPRRDAGVNYISNRILLCGPCNRRKSSRLTMSGLRDANRKKDVNWMLDEERADTAQRKAKRRAEEIQYEE